jgi:hypothetical protein
MFFMSPFSFLPGEVLRISPFVRGRPGTISIGWGGSWPWLNKFFEGKSEEFDGVSRLSGLLKFVFSFAKMGYLRRSNYVMHPACATSPRMGDGAHCDVLGKISGHTSLSQYGDATAAGACLHAPKSVFESYLKIFSIAIKILIEIHSQINQTLIFIFPSNFD